MWAAYYCFPTGYGNIRAYRNALILEIYGKYSKGAVSTRFTKSCSEIFDKFHKNIAYTFVKKETLEQMFFRKFCEIFTNSFFTENFQATISEFFKIIFKSVNFPMSICSCI